MWKTKPQQLCTDPVGRGLGFPAATGGNLLGVSQRMGAAIRYHTHHHVFPVTAKTKQRSTTTNVQIVRMRTDRENVHRSSNSTRIERILLDWLSRCKMSCKHHTALLPRAFFPLLKNAGFGTFPQTWINPDERANYGASCTP
jgi:hypothetical protein